MKTHCYTVYNWLYIQSMPDQRITAIIQIERIESVWEHAEHTTLISTHDGNRFAVTQSPVEIANLIANYVRKPDRDAYCPSVTPLESHVTKLERLAYRVASLNIGAIGEGALCSLISDARRALES